MKRSAIVLARVLGFIELKDLDPEGRVFLPDLVRGLVEKFRFQKFPQNLEDFDLDKGVEFQMGKAGSKVIQKFTIWRSLITVETRTSTGESKAFLEEALLWGAEKFGLVYSPGGIKRYGYISDVTFYSDVPLLTANPSIAKLATLTSEALSGIWQEPVEYKPVSIKIGHDPVSRKSGIAPFSIERWNQSRFSENKYFSEAPLPTEIHLQMLEKFEQEMMPTPL